MTPSYENISDSHNSRSTQYRANEERRRNEELATLLTFWSNDELVVEPEVSRRLYERERDCELTLSGSLDLVKQNPNIIWSHVADALQELHVARLKLKTYNVDKIRETLNIWRGLVAFDRSRASSLALALTSFGRFYCSIRRYADAEEACLEATNLYREIFTENPTEGRESGFFTMICLAEVYYETSRYDDAERALRMAAGFLKKIVVDKTRYEFVFERIRRKLDERSSAFGDSKDDRNLQDEALNYCRDASRLWRWGNLQEAEDSYRKAIDIYRDPSSLKNDVERRFRLAETLDELGRLCCQPKFAKYESAEAFFTESVSIQRELSALDPSYADAFATVLLNLATYYERKKRWNELEQTLREALETLGTRGDAFNPIVPSARARLANLLRRSNRAEEAVEEYRRALEQWSKAQGGAASFCREEIATTRFRLAELHKRAKRWDEAEESYEAAQKLFRELSEDDRESYAHKLASSLNNLATLRSNAERGSKSDVDLMIAERNYCEALTLYRRLREKDGNSVNFEFATALYNSALLHEKLNFVDEAEKEYLEALEIQRELAKDAPDEYAENVARILNNLAVLYRSNSSDPLRSEKAEPLYEEALRIYESLEREHPKTYLRKIVRTLRNLANVHSKDPDRKELAEEEYRRAATLLHDLIKRFPDVASYKSELADVYSRLGAAYFESGSFNDAKRRYLDALARYEELARVNSRKYSCKYAETFDELCDLYQATGAFTDALQGREAIVKIYEKASRENPSDRTLKVKQATSDYRLALACQKLGQDERARNAYLANLSVLNELSQEEPTPFRLDRARAYNNLAIVSQKLNRIEDAEAEYESAVGLYRELETDSPGAYHKDLSKTLNNLAVLYQKSNRLEDAEKNYVDALTIRRELAEENPQEHKPLLAVSLLNLSNFYFDQDRLQEAESNCREAVSIFEEYSSDDEQRRNFERAVTRLRGIRDEIEEREIREAFVEQTSEYPAATASNIRARVAHAYVSSIGDDMNAERDFLAQEVFPRVRLYCKRRGVEFVPIDLRQGESSKIDDARVLALGLQEIERTRPFFLGLVGDEYGRILPREALERNSEFKSVVLSAQNPPDAAMSALEAEFQFGVMRETRKVDAFFGLRSFETEGAEERTRREKPGTAPFKKLTTLKRKLRAQQFHPTFEYESLEALGEQIERALFAWIDRLWDAESVAAENAVDRAQRTFAERLRQNYVPNQADYDALDAFARSDSSVLTVVGALGAGKSSLLANWSTRFCRENSNRRVVSYYVGADDRSDAPSNVLNFLTRALSSEDSAVATSDEKGTLAERALAFSAAVAAFLKSSPETDLIVVIDGLNRLVDVGGAKNLTWLPYLPKRAKYLLSTVDCDVALEEVVRRGWDVYELNPAPLDVRYASLFATRNLGAFRSFEEFLDVLFARMEREFVENDEPLASRQDFAAISALLAASSCGLTREELRRASGFSSLKLLAILNALNCVLIVQGDRRRFVDEQFRRFALERYAQNAHEARRRIVEIYDADDNLDRLEVPFQYFQLEDWKKLRASLLDFDRFVALFDGTNACDFCKYWNASANDEESKFGSAWRLEFDLSSKTSEEICLYWRAFGDAARLYRDAQTAENAYRRALDASRESNLNVAEFFRALTRLSSLLREEERFEDAERELRAGLEESTARNVSFESTASIVSALVEIASLCRRSKRFDEAAKLCDDALSLGESVDDARVLLAAKLESARVRCDLSQFERSRQEYDAALKALRDLAIDNPFAFEPQIASTLLESARLRVADENYEDAESKLNEAETIYRELERKSRGAYDLELASTLDERARLFYQTDRLEDADENSREAASIWRELAAKDARFAANVASTLEFSARICFDLEEYEDAQDALTDALEIRRARQETGETARILCGLGNLYRRLKDWSGAEQYWLEARDIYRVLTAGERDVYDEDQARLQSALGDLYLAQGAFEKAEESYCDALVSYRGLTQQEVGGYDQDLARLLDNLGYVCWARDRARDAEEYYREALALYLDASKESPRERRSRIAEITRRLAFIDLDASRVEDAEREFADALKLERELVQEGAKDETNELADILFALANIRFADDRLEEAETDYLEALELRRKQAAKSPEKYDREVAATLVALATLHRQVNRLSESDAEFQIALESYRALTKDGSRELKPNLAYVLKNLAELHDEINRKTKADVEFNEASTIYRELNDETSGAFERELVATLRRWAEFCRESNRASDAKEKYREIASVGRLAPVETRSDYYFDALRALAETLTQTDEKIEASSVYRELIPAFCQKGELDREATLRFADALNKSARLRFDAGDYELVASEYEALATISRALAASDFDAESEELRRARQVLRDAYEK